jgi:glucans biosynthesis protein
VEIPTDSEHHDNIVSYWIADREIKAGEELRWEYNISAVLEGVALTAAWQVESTHVANLDEGKTKFVIEFSAASEGEQKEGSTKIASEVAATNGTIQNVVTQQNPVTGGWRTTFEVVAPKEEDIELKAYLIRGKERISETWVYHLRNP